MAKHTTIRRLVHAMDTANRGESVTTGLWDDPLWTPEEFRAWFFRKLNAKINASLPTLYGRKQSDEYAIELSRLKQYIGTRIVISWLSPALGKRVHATLSHRFRDGYTGYNFERDRLEGLRRKRLSDWRKRRRHSERFCRL